MISRSFDVSELNAVLNHPKVFPWVTIPGITHLDLTPVFNDPKNVLLKATDGFFFGTYEGPGVYEIHTQFYPWAKTRQTIADGFDAIKYAANIGTTELITRVPKNNRAADWLARRLGFKFWFMNKAVWPTYDGLVDLTFYRLQICQPHYQS